MTSKQTDNDSSDCKDFYQNMSSSLRSYCSMSSSDFSEEDLEMAYPIQADLKKLNERYKDAKLIGSGGIKEIFEVTDLKSAQSIAMAKLKKEAGRESIEAFLREARLTAGLQHPNIISVYDLGFDELNSPYFTMELLSGDNLHNIIKQSTKSITQLLDIFVKICDATAYAHSLQVIHLDLKPDNIQVGNFGEVHVCDWGLAKIITDDEELEIDEELDPNILNHATINGRIKGSPGYMAPEQAVANGDKDIRSDIYALGAILFTIFTGESPIKGETIDTLLEKTKKSLITPITNFPGIPKSMQAIITHCLACGPQDRYQTVEELKNDLDKYMHGYATAAEGAGFITQLSLLIQRNKKTLAILTLIILAFTVIIILSFQRIKNEREVAINSKNEAISNLKLLKEEQLLTESLKNETSLLFDEISRSDSLDSAQSKVRLLEEGIKREVDSKKRTRILKKMALLYFALQDFVAAQRTFQQLNGKFNQTLKQQCNWAIQTKGDKEQLNHRELAELFNKIFNPNQFELMKVMYTRHMNAYKHVKINPQEYLPLANIMLNSLNNLWDKKENTKLPYFENGRLKLPPRPYHRFRLSTHDINVLAPLKAKELDLSYTGFFEFIQLANLKLDKLNISGCKVNPINNSRVSMIKKSGVTHITYDSRFLQDSEVKTLKKHFTTLDQVLK